MLAQQQVKNAVEGLNKSYPNGWRCGHDFIDGLTVFLYASLQQMTETLFKIEKK